MENSRGDRAATAQREKWVGGFVRRSARGVPTYVIEKRVAGVYWKVSTRCHTERAAMKELERFEAGPSAYVPGAVVAEPLELTDTLILEHVEWQERVRGNTRGWAKECGRVLCDWAEDLGGVDLRTVAASDVQAILRGRDTSKPARVIALKGFMRWLRTVKGLLKHHEDCMPDVPIPRGAPSKRDRAVQLDRVERMAEHLAASTESHAAMLLDVLQVLVGTGWHLTEVMRFAKAGEVREDPTGQHLGVLVTWHKRKEWASTFAQHQEQLDAARRLRARGGLPSDTTLHKHWGLACDAAGVERFGLGDLRHSTATWATEAGTAPGDVSRALNHSSPKTTRQHYIRHSIPLGVMNVRRLRVVS